VAENYGELIGVMRGLLPQIEARLPAPGRGHGSTEFVREFSAAIGQASNAMLAELSELALADAARLAGRIRSAYPRGKTGNLQAGVSFNKQFYSQGRIGAWVRSNAPHVHFIESGTKVRQNASRKNANRGFVKFQGGPASPGQYQISFPLAVAARRDFYRRVQAIVDRDRRLG
jgi:hypothetical protein